MPMSVATRSADRSHLVAACLALAFIGGLALADTATVQANKDNMLIEDQFGELSNGAGSLLFVGRTGQFSDSIRRGLLAFDVAGAIPFGATVNSATLTLSETKHVPGAGNRDLALHRLLSDWGEGTSVGFSGQGQGAPATTGDATWKHTFFDTDTWSTDGGDFEPTASAVTNVGGPGVAYTWSSAPMAADVQLWLDDPAWNFGWLVKGDETVFRTAKVFASRTHPLITLRPKLDVDFTLNLESHSWSTTEASQTWSTPTNWTAAGVPASSWDVTLENSAVGGGQEAVVASDSAVHSVVVRGTAGEMAVRVADGVKLRTAGITLENNGRLDVAGTVDVPGAITVGSLGSASLVVQSSGLVQSTQPLTVESSGNLSGTGSVASAVSSGGTVEPGSSTGTLSIDGTYTQLADGVLRIELEGEDPGTEHDVLASTDLVTLDGSLELVPQGGYTDPDDRGGRDTFQFLTAGAVLATSFSNVRYDGIALAADFEDPNGSFRSHAGDGLFRNLSYLGASAEFSNYRALEGDANGDGGVTASGDGGILLANLNTPGNKTWIDADFNGDAATTASGDGSLLLSNLGQTADLASVPEPGTLWLLAMFVVLGMGTFFKVALAGAGSVPVLESNRCQCLDAE